ncbi:hypothetical protein [Halopseudomonas sp.]|uniref:hypothetical protein n=1 Tax=Halopseudomonas sp. TaxID=2901191 RepID=UPI0039E57BB0
MRTNKLWPWIVVTASLGWLAWVIWSSISAFITNADFRLWSEIVTSLIAIAGIQAHLDTVIQHAKHLAFGVTMQLNNAGEVRISKRKKELGKRIRFDNIEQIRVEAAPIKAWKKQLKAEGKNAEFRSAYGTTKLLSFKRCLEELAFIANISHCKLPSGKELADDDLADVSIALLKRIFSTYDLEHDLAFHAVCDQIYRPYIDQKQEVRPDTLFYIRRETVETLVTSMGLSSLDELLQWRPV